jgi:hypothetical protein
MRLDERRTPGKTKGQFTQEIFPDYGTHDLKVVFEHQAANLDLEQSTPKSYTLVAIALGGRF